MKIIITEEQNSLYVRRRYHCMKEYIDKLKSGEETIPVPTGDFEWWTYQIIMTAYVRKYCLGINYYDDNIHNEIMDIFGDDLYRYYVNN